MTLDQKIDSVKTAGATKMFWDGAERYGGKQAALRVYQCDTVSEAVDMLKGAVRYSIFKMDGEVIVQTK